MKNEYFDGLVASGEKMTSVQILIAKALLKCKDKLVVAEAPALCEDKAREIACELRNAEIKDLYINSSFSNQMDVWMALDASGLKLCGICMVENPRYAEEVERFGTSYCEEELPAFHFSFS